MVIAALSSVFVPQLKDILVFVLMAVVLLIRPAGLLGSAEGSMSGELRHYGGYLLVVLAMLILPRILYPVLALDILLWGLFAVALDLLLGYAGLLSFGHAMFWGVAGYTVRWPPARGKCHFRWRCWRGPLLPEWLRFRSASCRSGAPASTLRWSRRAFAQMLFFIINRWRDAHGR